MDALRSDLHIHTTFSDASCTVEETVRRAVDLRLDAIGITDHFWPSLGSKKGGLEVILERRALLGQLREEFPSLRILDGAEVDISADGSFAPVAGGLEQFDLVIGSIHFVCNSTQWASIMLRALKKNSFHILGHWDGYLSSYRPSDGAIVARALADHGVAVELSSRYPTQCEDFLELARDEGCLFSLGSDSHYVGAIGQLDDQRALVEAMDLPLLELSS